MSPVTALISKGLRRNTLMSSYVDRSRDSPDFKGIKTGRRMRISKALGSRDSPDFKGIKTSHPLPSRHPLRPGTALISKGLRHHRGDEREHAGQSRDNPDFKGIKTSQQHIETGRFRPGTSLISKGLRPALSKDFVCFLTTGSVWRNKLTLSPKASAPCNRQILLGHGTRTGPSSWMKRYAGPRL